MKKISIFALPSHTYIDRVSGVDYARVIQPMKYLNGYKDNNCEFEVRIYDHSKNESFDWREIFQDYDIVYFNYTSNDVGYAIMGTLRQKYNRKLVVDLDDDLFSIRLDNPSYDAFKKGSWGRTVIKAIFNDVDHITVTNRHLKHSLVFHADIPADKISILTNYIDLSFYKYRCKFKDRGYYRALYFGSSTHFPDLDNPVFIDAMDRVMKDYPNFSFMSIGSFIPKFRKMWGERYVNGFGHGDLLKWIKLQPKYMDETDFMVVPLINDSYNRSKSEIKYLEASSYKIPGVWQNIRQYQGCVKNGVNGFLASTSDEWYNSITTLINNAKLRKSMGEEAFKTIHKWEIQRNVKGYADMFKKTLDI